MFLFRKFQEIRRDWIVSKVTSQNKLLFEAENRRDVESDPIQKEKLNIQINSLKKQIESYLAEIEQIEKKIKILERPEKEYKKPRNADKRPEPYWINIWVKIIVGVFVILLLVFQFFLPPLRQDREMKLITGGEIYLDVEYKNNKSRSKFSFNDFYIDKNEVTVKDYLNFCKKNNLEYPDNPKFATLPNYFLAKEYQDYPIVNVSWQEAYNYCKSCGKRLPTELEWIVAAKFFENKEVKNPFINESGKPTGNVPDKSLVRYEGFKNYRSLNLDDANAFPSKVRSYEPNQNGIFDLDGNVSEWCMDNYFLEVQKQESYLVDKVIKENNYKVVKGASWKRWSNIDFRRKIDKNKKFDDLGFRCTKLKGKPSQ
jgi:formylglycine-generating enzyme required for sulfatase activity